MLLCFFLKILFPSSHRVPSSETQGQIVGARESLNGMARRKVKTGGKEPLGTMSYQTSLKFSGTNLASSLYGVLLVPIGQFISVTYPRRTGWERPHIFAWTTRPETLWPRGIMSNQHLVRHCPQGLFLPFFTFLRAIFPPRLGFPSPSLSAPGSPRMIAFKTVQTGRNFFNWKM